MMLIWDHSWAYFMGLFIGPIIAGAIASQITWRWFVSQTLQNHD